MRRNYERTLIPVIRSVKHISTCGESTELKHGAHFWAPSTSPQNWGHLSWWGRSKRPHSNLGRCRCVVFGTGSHTAIPSAQCRPPWPADLCSQNENSGSQSHRGTRFLCLQFSWCYGNLSSVTSVTKTVIYYEAFYFPSNRGLLRNTDAFIWALLNFPHFEDCWAFTGLETAH